MRLICHKVVTQGNIRKKRRLIKTSHFLLSPSILGILCSLFPDCPMDLVVVWVGLEDEETCDLHLIN